MPAFVLVVPRADSELAADHLFGLGVTAVEERESSVDGSVELWTEVGNGEASISAAVASLRPPWSWRSVAVDASVTERWRAYASPTWVTDDVVIVPAWLTGSTDTADALAVAIDPGAAFGLGDHPTTQLTTRLMLDALVAGDQAVLDVGCGSGVLAIVAARRGARRVEAIDISTAAIEATRLNVTANGVADRVFASTTLLAHVEATFDVVVANVLAPVLVEMADDLRRVLAPGGTLIVSGVRADRHDHVLRALGPFVDTHTVTMDGWAAIGLSDNPDRPNRRESGAAK